MDPDVGVHHDGGWASLHPTTGGHTQRYSASSPVPAPSVPCRLPGSHLLRVTVRSRGTFQVGPALTNDHLADLERLEFDVEIPSDCGVLALLSAGWRKALFYDFGPISGNHPQPRTYDLGVVLGQGYGQLLFQERFGISDADWQKLFRHKWFLFTGLSDESKRTLLNHIRSGWDPDVQLPRYADEVKSRVEGWLTDWREHALFMPHIEILEHAAKRFLDGDSISCTGLLFPRIEGLLRSQYTTLGATSQPTANNLSRSAVAAKRTQEKCLLLPRRFASYLQQVFFANFSPTTGDIDVSRHSVAHGVASPKRFDQKSAVIALLVIQQLYFFLDKHAVSQAAEETAVAVKS